MDQGQSIMNGDRPAEFIESGGQRQTSGSQKQLGGNEPGSTSLSFSTVLCEEKDLNANSNDPPYFTELATLGTQTIVRCNSSFSKKVK